MSDDREGAKVVAPQRLGTQPLQEEKEDLMRASLNHEAQHRYDRYVLAALNGGCDQRQAEMIAKQRYLAEAERLSETLRLTRKTTPLPPR